MLNTLHDELNNAPNIKKDNNYSANNQNFQEKVHILTNLKVNLKE